MKKNNSKKVITILKVIYYAAFIALAAWFFISWYQVISTNCLPETSGQIPDWNMFQVFFGK